MTSQGKKFLSVLFLVIAFILGVFTQTAPGTTGGDIITGLIFLSAGASMAVLFLPEKEKTASQNSNERFDYSQINPN